ncbi:DUF6479 family protein [Fictibacillus barbaricus]|uniref:Uncharacterized protein n=1 Tax=Fictibacillus barbaricus TaxID=182136 RepID=A0ABU1U3D9_9BACL|nr:DUF6479 family protein [Fictibacillus barbaricus]MDR7074002.1 hypothetical protein [Fictibacillus barbaricus]
MIGILLLVVAVIIIAVLIVINTRALASKSRGNKPADEEIESHVSVSAEPVEEASLKEEAAPVQEKASEKDPNKMDDQEYRNALKRLKSAKPIKKEESPKTQSMKDNDYRNALKSMKEKRDN